MPAGACLWSGLRPSRRQAPAGTLTGNHNRRWTGNHNCRRAARGDLVEETGIALHPGHHQGTLQRGEQAVDNAMNLWHVSTIEHGASLGVNPNY